MFRKTQSCCWGCSSGWGFCTHTHVFLVGCCCCCCCRYPREVGEVELPALGLGWRVHFPLGPLTSRLGAVVLPQKAAVAHQGGAIVQNCQCIVIIKSSMTVRQFIIALNFSSQCTPLLTVPRAGCPPCTLLGMPWVGKVSFPSGNACPAHASAVKLKYKENRLAQEKPVPVSDFPWEGPCGSKPGDQEQE